MQSAIGGKLGVTKTELFTPAQNDLAQIAKAFAHPARVAIIQQLLNSRTCANGQLVQELGLAQATVSQHLSELKDIGIIQGTIGGISISYCINPTRWTEIRELFNRTFDQYTDPSGIDCFQQQRISEQYVEHET